jgi:hypothetical protein
LKKELDEDLSLNCVIPSFKIYDIEFIKRSRGKGLIIAGYPCIGKSSIAGTICDLPVIDLESSNFSKDAPCWEIEYIRVAHDLANQGFIVFVSSHDHVVSNLLNIKDVETCSICPCRELYTEWVVKATRRYEATNLDKDKRSLDRIVNYFKQDVENLRCCGLKNYTIYDRNYNLESIVLEIYRALNDNTN